MYPVVLGYHPELMGVNLHQGLLLGLRPLEVPAREDVGRDVLDPQLKAPVEEGLDLVSTHGVGLHLQNPGLSGVPAVTIGYHGQMGRDIPDTFGGS